MVYLLLELCTGGELYQYLKAQPGRIIHPDSARFFTACIIKGLEQIHRHDIVYRDLKPENLIISAEGYVKIVDFGLAKKTLRTFTVCGTPEYMAPEVVLSRGYDRAVDYWASGVILFEMICGEYSSVQGVQILVQALLHELIKSMPAILVCK